MPRPTLPASVHICWLRFLNSDGDLPDERIAETRDSLALMLDMLVQGDPYGTIGVTVHAARVKRQNHPCPPTRLAIGV